MSETQQATQDAGNQQTGTSDQIQQTDQTQKTQATEQSSGKTEDGKPSLLNEKGDKTATAQQAPEKYADFTAPEGFELVPEVVAEASTIFKELNLSQEGAQKLVDLYAKQAQDAAKAPFDLWQKTQDEWVAEIKADPAIGGKLDQVKATISKAIDGLGDPKLASDFRQAMDFTGAGNNPAFIRAFYRIAQKVTEGTPIKPGGPVEVKPDGSTGGRPTLAAAMYPKLPAAGT